MAQMSELPKRVPVAILIPTSQYPWLKRIVNSLRCKCPNCTREMQTPVWFSFLEAHEAGYVEPIAGPAIKGRQQVSAQGMIATSFAVFCPKCGGPAGEPTDNGLLDLLVIPKDWVQNVSGEGTGTVLTFEGDKPEHIPARMDAPAVVMEHEEVPVPAPRGKGKNKRAKISDMSPANRKVARDLAQDQKNAKKALERAKKAGLLDAAVKENKTKADVGAFKAAQLSPEPKGKKAVKNV